MGYRLYVDTSVLGALFDEEDPTRLRATRRLLEMCAAGRFEAHIGQEVIAEVSRAPVRIRSGLLDAIRGLRPTLVEPSDASEKLFEAYLATDAFRKGSRMDARHLAIATVAGTDALVSWNYRDMVNLGRKRLVHSVNIKHGYHMIDIVSPSEVPGVEG